LLCGVGLELGGGWFLFVWWGGGGVGVFFCNRLKGDGRGRGFILSFKYFFKVLNG